MSSSDFWVVFDTGTKPAYYGDVHNLLALPEGEIIRYNYRLEQMSERARELVASDGHLIKDVLLIYTQPEDFKRGDPTRSSDDSWESNFWLATRLAEMALVYQEGGRAHFDLRVRGYPTQGGDFRSVIEALKADGDVPFRTWVAAGSGVAYKNLGVGKPQSNWEAIVDILGSPPSQFAGDSFWRLREPTGAIRPLSRDEEQMERLEGGVARPYQVKARWHLREGQTGSIAVVSHTPKTAAEEEPAQRFVDVSTPGNSLKTSTERVQLRRYTEETIKIVASRSEDAGSVSARTSFITAPGRADWPMGPDLTITFLVKKRTRALILAFLFGFLAVASLIVVGEVSSLVWKICWAVAAAALGALAAFFGTGKIHIPKG